MSGHRRHFVTVAGRQVHMRWAGSGPPVVLLHACPKSSVEQAPLVERLSRRFTAFAFDIPGYGDSEPLPLPRPEIADFADAFAATLETLGIGRAAAYGRHTGGLIVLDLAQRHRGRLSRIILDGFPVFTEAERQRFLTGYLQPLLPLWDGLHLPGLWARLRENYLFFPWNEGPLPENRNPIDMPPAEQMHATAVDMLKVMDLWRLGYAAAFRYRPQAALAALDCPALIMARRDDLLHPHLERLPPLPANVAVEAHSHDVAAWADRIEGFLADADPLPAAPRPAATRPRPDRPWSEIVDTPTGPVRLRHAGAGQKRLMLLHDLPGSGMVELPLMRHLADVARVTIPDLPGVGLSAALPEGAGQADLLDTLETLWRREGCTVLASRGLTSGLALALAARHGSTHPLALIRPCFPPAGDTDGFAAAHAPDIPPCDAGTHLTRLWTIARDNELYFPWFTPRREAIRAGLRPLDPERLTAQVVAMAENPAGYRRLVLAAVDPSGGSPAPHPGRALLVADPDRIGHDLADRAADILPAASRETVVLPTVETEAAALRPWLSGL